MRNTSELETQHRLGPDKDNDSQLEDQTTRVLKRKRNSNKPSDKTYECSTEGCGKTYSRAEHLYRHQLNHAPKQVYQCGFGDCDRNFVRQDLCARHRARHTNENSTLFRKGAFKQNNNRLTSQSTLNESKKTLCLPPIDDQMISSATTGPEITVHQDSKHANPSKPANSLPDFSSVVLDPLLTRGTTNFQAVQHNDAFSGVLSRDRHQDHEAHVAAIDGPLEPHPGLPAGFSHSQHSVSSTLEPPMQHVMRPPNDGTNAGGFERSHVSTNTSTHHTQPVSLYDFNPAHGLFAPLHTGSAPHLPQPYMSSATGNYKQQSAMASVPSFPSFGISLPLSQSGNGRTDSVTSYASKGAPAESHLANNYHGIGFTNAQVPGMVRAGMTMPVFNNELHGPLPFDVPEMEFMGWLFEGNQSWISPQSQTPIGGQDAYFNTPHHDANLQGRNVHLELPLKAQLAPKIAIDNTQPESLLSDSRRQQILRSILTNFKDERHSRVTTQREKILQGDYDADSHVLSLRMMKIYIGSFWLHIHGQLPIMHRPTFSAETCPDLLLIPMMVLGASCLEKTYGYEVTQACAELSYFLAWHARHMIFEDADFLPPAKLWVFQALLLLEIFEKMYSTRSLHERAHVHHSTTLTLMRRGSSLIGRSALDFPPYDRDPTRTPPGPNGSINTAGQNTTDEWWNGWISNEATRRTAFAAFIIDTIHANMFGHSAVMVAHEMRMPLPCDEALWTAASGAEVKRLENSFVSQGHRPAGFLEALKKTLNSQSVRTNTFGRVIIMAGLLSVSWHMKMQDLRVSSVGVGKQSSWASQLLHAFDFWKRDFDDSLANSSEVYLLSLSHGYHGDQDNVFESRTVLHHLAHMAMQADIVDCQIYAGAKRLMGRVITEPDRVAASNRIRDVWATSPRARNAAFYALRFLSEVLLAEDDSPASSQHVRSDLGYSAREDNLLNRPWVLYIAALVVWAYGYSMDGPIATPTYALSTHETQFRDMQFFLRRVGGVKTPGDLLNIGHRNGSLGLLMVLRDLFMETRWELLHEASAMLGNCIEMLMPGSSSVNA